jgi:hypothetical protein
MTRNDQSVPWRKVSFDEVKIGPTDATGDDPKTNLSPCGLWNLALDGYERTRIHRTRCRNRPRTHDVTHINLLTTPYYTLF